MIKNKRLMKYLETKTFTNKQNLLEGSDIIVGLQSNSTSDELIKRVKYI